MRTRRPPGRDGGQSLPVRGPRCRRGATVGAAPTRRSDRSTCPRRRSGRLGREHGGKPRDAEHERARRARRAVTLGQPQIVQVLEQRLEHRAHFEPGEVGAEAEVRPGSEGEMRVRGPVDAQLVGCLEHRLVAVRRLVEQQQAVAGLDLLAAELVID